MKLKAGRVVLVAGLLALAAGSVVAARLGYVERLRLKLWGRPAHLSAGDFPAGVSAPVDDWASVPTRPVLVGVVPRGTVAPLLWAAGDAQRVGLFRGAYALDVTVKAYPREDELKRALVLGAENGGVDAAALTVPSLAMSSALLRDAAPRTVLLLGRSRGEDALAARTAKAPAELTGKRLGVELRGTSHYFALWVMSRAGLTTRDVTLVPLDGPPGDALRAGTVDAVAGPAGELAPVVKDLGAATISTTADAPHLLATVLVVRGEFAARYPDAVRRLVRGTLDADTQVLKDATAAARVLGEVAPQLGDPTEAIRAAPPASVRDNLAFFSLGQESPVTYGELYRSAAELAVKLFGAPAAPEPDDTADLGPLKYVSSARGP